MSPTKPLATQIDCQILQLLQSLNATQFLEPVESCLSVTVNGQWGTIGDELLQIQWYRVDTNVPTYVTSTFYNKNTQNIVAGVTSANTVSCGAGSITITGFSTAANQTNASQKAQIVDGSGNVIASTSNALNVAIVSGGGSGGTASNFGAAFPASGTATGFKDSTGTNMVAGNLDASGFLKVNVAAGGGAGGTSSSFGAAFPATGTATGFLNSAGTNMVAGNLDASGFLKVNVAAGGGAGGTSSSFGAAIPGTGTAAGFSDGTNMQLARVFDADTGAGTQYIPGANLRISANSGSIEAKGQQVSASSLPVVIASDQSGVPVTGTFFPGTQPVTGTFFPATQPVSNAGTFAVQAAQTGTWNITNISGTVSLPTGAATAANQTNASQKAQIVDGSGNVIASTSNALNVAIVSGGGSGGTASNFGAAFPASGTATGFKDSTGTNMVAGNLNASGALKVDGSAVTQPVSQATAASLNAQVVGALSIGSTVSGNPVLSGFKVLDVPVSTVSSPPTNGQVIVPTTDRYGRQQKICPVVLQISSNGTPITTAANTSIITAPGSFTHIRLHRIHASNSSATGTWVYWRDGTSGNKSYPTFLSQNTTMSLRLEGNMDLTGGASPNALFLNTASAANVEWHVDYEIVGG